MATVHTTTRDGQHLDMPAQEGLSLMEILRDNGIEDAFALCGGCCSCATCHVYIDPDRLALLPPMSEDESDLLDGSAHRQANSRLSCQIPWSAALDGLTVSVAPQG
jgi:2Fe-2S ferredoxin